MGLPSNHHRSPPAEESAVAVEVAGHVPIVAGDGHRVNATAPPTLACERDGLAGTVIAETTATTLPQQMFMIGLATDNLGGAPRDAWTQTSGRVIDGAAAVRVATAPVRRGRQRPPPPRQSPPPMPRLVGRARQGRGRWVARVPSSAGSRQREACAPARWQPSRRPRPSPSRTVGRASCYRFARGGLDEGEPTFCLRHGSSSAGPRHPRCRRLP